jgi:hypothetical protein
MCQNNGFTVGNPTASAGGTPNGIISADTPDANNLRVFTNNVPFSLNVVTNVGSADTVTWTANDTFGTRVASGSFQYR